MLMGGTGGSRSHGNSTSSNSHSRGHSRKIRKGLDAADVGKNSIQFMTRALVEFNQRVM